MIQKIFPLLSRPGESENHSRGLSFNRFVAYLEDKVKTEHSLRQKFYEFVLQHFHHYAGEATPFNLHQLQQYTGLLDLLYVCLFPPLSNEEDVLWALSTPDMDTVFYGTPAFYKVFSALQENPGIFAAETDKKAFYNSIDQMKYALILERYYHLQHFTKEEIVYTSTDTTTGLPTYYSIAADNRFIAVQRNEGAAAVTDKNAITQQLQTISSLCEMECSIPLSSFTFTGFAIVIVTDITARYALHKMRSAIIAHAPENVEATYRIILSLLQAFCGTKNIAFGLLPFIKLNNRLVSFYKSYPFSITINVARAQQIKETYFLAWINKHFKNPRMLFFKEEGDTGKAQDLFYKAFVNAGIKEYALLPVYHNNELTGMLEVSATMANTVTEITLARLDAAMPILAQLMHNNQAEFEAGIDKIIKTNFTAIQPAVQWKFNEVAWKYLRDKIGKAADAEPIRFEHVHPLYGAIDIRNSTVERNKALYKDMQFYFSFLAETLQGINTDNISAISDLLGEAEELQQQTGLYFSGSEEAAIEQFAERVTAYLQSFAVAHPAAAAVINAYLSAMEPAAGAVHGERRALETAMQIINGAINKQLEEMQARLQESYPFYFEKFRTDGVEYDMYIGQSIAPAQEYKMEYLQQLRLEQLRSMAAIARIVAAGEAGVPVRLQTTQLIYVNASAIDISFRRDEKRFDVEGGYNIRYHVIKKRIDKVHLKDTGERLTQPDAIAIVYTQKSHEEEYMEYIGRLQQEGLLQQDARLYELEELQGVTGLKAIRVSVVRGA